MQVGRFSLWEFCEGNLEGGLPCWGTWKIGRKEKAMKENNMNFKKS
jgi:hypothetical protein